MGIGYVDSVVVYNRYINGLMETETYFGTRFDNVRVELTQEQIKRQAAWKTPVCAWLKSRMSICRSRTRRQKCGTTSQQRICLKVSRLTPEGRIFCNREEKRNWALTLMCLSD